MWHKYADQFGREWWLSEWDGAGPADGWLSPNGEPDGYYLDTQPRHTDAVYVVRVDDPAGGP